jgi:SAM-dependent methyltransferase
MYRETGTYAYDLVPFRSTSVPGADYRRIEVIARLFGVPAAPCAQARILELGCGTAANLIALALEHPRTCFIGCDLSRNALASAQRLVDHLGLKNVELRHIDICDVDDGWGSFDYIVCHDVFSWVGPDVGQKILAIQKRNLASHGVGYVSFDALPGWQLHGIARDMMQYHAAGLSDPQQAVDHARAMLAMGAAVQDQNEGPYAALLREEYFLLSRISDEQLYHLAFTEHHRPFYLHEFIRLLDEAGLQFLGDSDPTRLFGPRDPAAVRAFLDQLPQSDQQQYSDFLVNCTCHGALMCHRDVRIRSRPDEEVLRDCWISRTTAARDEWVARKALTDEVLCYLDETRPEFVAFRDLVQSESAPMADFLDAYAAGLIDVALAPRRLSGHISDRPTVSPLVRLQAKESATVTNQRCEPVRLTDLARYVVTLLDGAHSMSDVVESVGQEINAGRAGNDRILRLQDEELIAERVTGDILLHLRDHALLVA